MMPFEWPHPTSTSSAGYEGKQTMQLEKAQYALAVLLIAATGFVIYVWDQCYAMEQSLRIE